MALKLFILCVSLLVHHSPIICPYDAINSLFLFPATQTHSPAQTNFKSPVSFPFKYTSSSQCHAATAGTQIDPTLAHTAGYHNAVLHSPFLFAQSRIYPTLSLAHYHSGRYSGLSVTLCRQ